MTDAGCARTTFVHRGRHNQQNLKLVRQLRAARHSLILDCIYLQPLRHQAGLVADQQKISELSLRTFSPTRPLVITV